MISQLVQMGFERDATMSALKVTNNHPAAACEWLCDERSNSLLEIQNGIAMESTVIKTLLESASFQEDLGSPKMFIGKVQFRQT